MTSLRGLSDFADGFIINFQMDATPRKIYDKLRGKSDKPEGAAFIRYKFHLAGVYVFQDELRGRILKEEIIEIVEIIKNLKTEHR